jgi:homoserine dehydrogenase
MSPTPPPLPEFKLALLGFGNVGQALIELLLEKRADLEINPGISFKVVGIASGSHGRAIDPRGLPMQEILKAYRKGEALSGFSSLEVNTSEEFAHKCGADVLFESTPVNYQTGQPALEYIKIALENGLHAITANKGPVVHGYRDLTKIARQNRVSFLFESSVMDGAPVFSLARTGFPGARIQEFSGILNSTTNLILSRMENGETQEEAIAYAQSIGIAETDPSGDVDGWDAAVKVAALVTVLMDVPFLPQDVDRVGIRSLTHDLIHDAAERGNRWKLLCRARLDPESARGVLAEVKPTEIGPDSQLYHITGTSAILQIKSDVLGNLSLIEDSPSTKTTAYGMLADFLNAVT